MKTKRQLIVTVMLVLFFAIVCAGQAFALTFESQPSFDEIVITAPLAFRGKVLRIAYGYAKGSDTTSIPYTNITLQVGQSFAGSEIGQEVTLRQMGGPIKGKPNQVLLIPGLVEFQTGEEVYVFADDRKQPFFATLYGDLSVYRVAKDETGVERVLTSLWQQVYFNGQRLRTLTSQYCRPQASSRGRCTLKIERLRDQEDPQDTPKAVEGFKDLSPTVFDARIRALRSTSQGQALPGQTLSKDRAAFESALVALRTRGLQSRRRVSSRTNQDFK